MDSKHRHEREQNTLEKWMVSLYRNFIRPNSSWLSYAVLGVLVVIIVVMATMQVNRWNDESAWKQYYTALNSEQASTDLQVVAESTSDKIGILARLALAQIQLSEGITQVFADKVKAVEQLELAITSFQQVQKKTSAPSLLQQANFGLGQCWETLATARVGADDLKKANEAYQSIVERWGDTFTATRAQKRLDSIRLPSTKKFIELAAAKIIVPPSEAGTESSFDVNAPVSPNLDIDFATLLGDSAEGAKIDEPPAEVSTPVQE